MDSRMLKEFHENASELLRKAAQHTQGLRRLFPPPHFGEFFC